MKDTNSVTQKHAFDVAEAESNILEIVLPVVGMTCANCGAIIERNIAKLPGVTLAQINFSGETLRLHIQPRTINVSKIRKKIEYLGYKIPVLVRYFALPYSDSPSDRHIFEKKLNQPSFAELAGYSINVLQGRLNIEVPVTGVPWEPIKKKLLDLGMKIIDTQTADENFEYLEEKRQARLLYSAIGFALPLFVLSMARDFSLFTLPISHFSQNVIFMLLATPVQFWIGADFYKGAYKSVRSGSANMDTLVALGSSVAFFYSLSVLNNPHQHVYFETAAMIITLIKVGKYLESKAKRKTGEFLKSIVQLVPKKARVSQDGMEKLMPLGDIKPGDIIHLRPGEKVPLDCKVQRGSGTMNFAVVTGESLPVEVTSGSSLYAGVLNIDGHIEAIVERSEEEGLLGQIIKMVSIAQASKAPIQKYADEISKYFVPAVILLSILTFAFWIVLDDYQHALIRMVAVLVVACPCALGLATPTAIAVALGAGAKMGLFFKSSESIQNLSQVNVVCFDKTGTITEGNLRLTEIIPESPYTENEFLSVIASLENGSEHPIGKAIVREAKARQLPLELTTQFKAHPGGGIAATMAEKNYLVGHPEFLQDQHIVINAYLLDRVESLRSEGKTVVGLSENDKILGFVALADAVRSNSAEVIKKLKTFLTLYLMTGDHKNVAQQVAKKVGIDHVTAQLKPKEKLQQIKDLQNEGNIVAMIGDGINDAPALAKANVGIAMGGGTDVALSSADITLVTNDLSRLSQAFTLSKFTMKIIKQNFLWAFIYNITLIPLAAGVLFFLPSTLPLWMRELHPIMAALAMSFSSISVVLNSLRINRFSA